MRLENEVYYKVYVGLDDLIHVVCMQWFDEDGYDQNRFYYDEKGEVVKFPTEESAIEFINKKFKPRYINPIHRRIDNCWKHMELD